MMKRVGTAVTAVVMAVVLTGCNNEGDDCDARDISTEAGGVAVMALTDGNPKPKPKVNKPKKPKVKVDDDWFEDCDD